MPVMMGIECLKKIKADERLKDIPVIMYTSDTRPRWANIQIKRYQDLGVTHFMSKVSTFQEIVVTLKAFFVKGPGDLPHDG
jgi:CheY-like chemotaxis protein